MGLKLLIKQTLEVTSSLRLSRLALTPVFGAQPEIVLIVIVQIEAMVEPKSVIAELKAIRKGKGLRNL